MTNAHDHLPASFQDVADWVSWRDGLCGMPTTDSDGAPLDDATIAEYGVRYFGEGHDELMPEDLYFIAGQVALDRRRAADA